MEKSLAERTVGALSGVGRVGENFGSCGSLVTRKLCKKIHFVSPTFDKKQKGDKRGHFLRGCLTFSFLPGYPHHSSRFYQVSEGICDMDVVEF